MKKKIYIHIGTPKTGSTSIQRYLTSHQKNLHDQGLYYPIAGRAYREDQTKINCLKSEQADIFICMNGDIVRSSETLHPILSNFNEQKAGSMLLSEECLFLGSALAHSLKDRHIWRLLSDYDVQVIVYLRPAIEYLCSLWAEMIKMGDTTELDTFLLEHPYSDNLRSLFDVSQKIGTANMFIKTFEKKTWVGGSLINDFMRVFGIEEIASENEKSFQNITYSRYQTEKRLFVNKILKSKITEDGHLISKKISKTGSNQPTLETVSDQMIEKVFKKYHPLECELGRKFANQNELFRLKYPYASSTSRNAFKKGIDWEDQKELYSIAQQIRKEKKQSWSQLFLPPGRRAA